MALTALSILAGYYALDAKGASMLSKYQREIILSYRLLFGQDRKSRRLFREVESRNAALDKTSKCDPLLDILCGRKKRAVIDALPSDIWPDSCRDSAGHLLEQTIYSTSLDFPVLGSRLLQIQEFDSRQQPNRIRDYWRDRRNPLQWYAFWAVLIIGALSILIGIIQIILAILQLNLD